MASAQQQDQSDFMLPLDDVQVQNLGNDKVKKVKKYTEITPIANKISKPLTRAISPQDEITKMNK